MEGTWVRQLAKSHRSRCAECGCTIPHATLRYGRYDVSWWACDEYVLTFFCPRHTPDHVRAQLDAD